MKKIEVLQEDKNDCAAACLLSIIRFYDGNLSMEDIRKLIKTNINGTNAYDLMSGAKDIGFDTTSKHLSFEELIKETMNEINTKYEKENQKDACICFDDSRFYNCIYYQCECRRILRGRPFSTCVLFYESFSCERVSWTVYLVLLGTCLRKNRGFLA